MSHVDDVFLSFAGIEEHEDRGDADHYPVMDTINAWLLERTRQQFGPELSSCMNAYGGRKVMQATVFVGAFNYMPEDEFLEFLRTLPWEFPDQVQYIVRREHSEHGFDLVSVFADEESTSLREE